MSDQEPGRPSDLLSPVLDAQAPPQPLFSPGAEFLTAFFGGPFAILILSAMNARILGRLKADLWRYVLGAAAGTVVVVFLAWLRFADPPPQWYAAAVGDQASRVLRWTSSLFALLLWLWFWLTYRRYHKAAELTGLGSRNPWGPAIVSIVIGWMMLFLINIIVAGLP